MKDPDAQGEGNRAIFVEAPAFSSKVDQHLNSKEREALRLLLAVDPLSGIPSAAHPNILEIEFAGCVIAYMIGRKGVRIYLLDIDQFKTPTPTPEEKSELDKWMKRAAGAGLIVMVKEVVKKVIEIIKDWPF